MNQYQMLLPSMYLDLIISFCTPRIVIQMFDSFPAISLFFTENSLYFLMSLMFCAKLIQLLMIRFSFVFYFKKELNSHKILMDF